jgi:hypothetical protein
MFMISPQTFLHAWHEGMRLHSQLFWVVVTLHPYAHRSTAPFSQRMSDRRPESSPLAAISVQSEITLQHTFVPREVLAQKNPYYIMVLSHISAAQLRVTRAKNLNRTK